MYISGRVKDMFMNGRVNVYPAEVEQAILARPSVQDAAAGVGIDGKWR